ncbi:hypothetical protein K7X08_006302 [Anisodus acutangulus]|uniref:Uncharacterized protein n=1 Tax=Anisodus acutangulus TaxID=402998 RepID=A0A9Q1MVT3_9SOLA|nr:hypothetical protein K7X08_006302 [Anisodus acutangulus]
MPVVVHSSESTSSIVFSGVFKNQISATTTSTTIVYFPFQYRSSGLSLDFLNFSLDLDRLVPIVSIPN